MNPQSFPLAHDALVALLEGGVSVCVATRGRDGLPSLSRALGCKVSRDRRRLSVFLARSQAADVLEDVRAHGAIALVASHPLTHRSYQFKGTDAAVRPLGRGEAARVRAYVETFVRVVEPEGYSPRLIRALFASPPETPEDWVAVTFTPTSAFSQTPGPSAGDPLGEAP